MAADRIVKQKAIDRPFKRRRTAMDGILRQALKGIK